MPTAPPAKPSVWNWILIGVVLIGGLVYLAISRKDAAAAMPQPAGAAGNAILQAGDVVGRTAPNWTMTDVNGHPVSLSQFAGRPVVMDFWATWCGPCQVELPWWKQLQAKYRAQGLQIIGVSEDGALSDVKNYLQKHPLNYEIVWDNQALQNSYGVPFGLPTTLFINRQGKITQRVMGLEGKPELDRAIRGIL
jgi:peroxiredoxin